MTIRAVFYGHTFSWTTVNGARTHLQDPLIRLDEGDQLKLVWENGSLTTLVKHLGEGRYDVGVHKDNRWHGRNVTGVLELGLEDVVLFARLANFSFLPVAFFAGACLKAELKEAPIIGLALSVISCMGLHYGLQRRVWNVVQAVLRIHESASNSNEQSADYVIGNKYDSENYQLDPWSRLVGYGLSQ